MSRRRPIFHRKKTHARVLLVILGIMLSGNLSPLQAQQTDSLLLNEFLVLVERNHPVARQANLLTAQAQARLKRARGGFDPKLYGDAQQKVFKESNYFRYLEGGLKFPTRLGGLEGKVNYENTTGVFLNPEATLPDDGLIKTGISMPLARGLLIDSRRAALQQAKIMIGANENDRILQINTLMRDASLAYWEWARAYWQQQVFQEALRLAVVRQQAVKQSAAYGDRATIDTLEASIQVRNRRLSLNEARLAYQKASAYLGVFLWDESGQARTLPEEVRPPNPPRIFVFPIQTDSLMRLQQRMAAHPIVRKYDFKQAGLEVERRLKTDKFKPDLRVEVSMLTDPKAMEGDTDLFGGYFWGGSLQVPLFYRKIRGDVELTRIKMQDNEWQRTQKAQEMRAKLQAVWAEIQNLDTQLDQASQNVGAYQDLLQAENDKFRLGESSLFLVNSRETKLIESQVKLLALQAKYQLAIAEWEWLSNW
jgi:outer membrane protein TolC